ncbi:MAG: V-type ATP synthase subunit E [Candidatus Bathyarchaeia archaeon]
MIELIERRGLEGLREAIIKRAEEEAARIIKEAEEEVRAEVERARRAKDDEVKAIKERLLKEAEVEAARILARARIRAKNIVLEAKNRVIEEIIELAKRALSGYSLEREGSLAHLLRESVVALGGGKLRVMVSKGDLEIVKRLIQGDEEFSKKVREVAETECSGGVIVEEVNGGVRIDNTYEARLAMLIPRFLPIIEKELLKGA